jgi:hypothetical protein
MIDSGLAGSVGQLEAKDTVLEMVGILAEWFESVAKLGGNQHIDIFWGNGKK